jgi:hypothetical protein
MTTTPPAQKPLRKFDSIAGPIIFLFGILLFAAVLIWLGLYLNERSLAQFFSEWPYWLPVCIFLAPAIHLIHYGKAMMLGRTIRLITYFEILAILIILTIVGLIGFN